MMARRCAAFQISPEALEAALEGRVLQVYYQPVVDCASGALVGFESLARWPHPDLGMILPHQFIPIAERSGLIGPLVSQLMEEALSWFAESFGGTATTITMNLSALLLSDLQLPGWLIQRCSDLAINPRQIILAIPESDAIMSQSSTTNLVMQLRLHGFPLCIGNFGVGYSSLRQLAQLPFSELKIDKRIVRQASESEEAREVVGRVIGLSKAVSLQVTANGVGDEWTFDFLRRRGCDAAQGSWIAPPMDSAATLAWCESWTGRHDENPS
jgi:EAL domain-containing protein (putative c-di-GMP-specific phosphodiesterase class I)